MKNNLVLILLLTCMIASPAYSLKDKANLHNVNKNDSLKTNDEKKNEVKLIEELQKIITLHEGTLKVYTVNKSEEVSGFDIQKNMPWIGAVLIGLLTVAANILTNIQIRKANDKSLEKQLQNAKDINQRDFNKTVLSGNRQLWINDLRDNVSIVLSKMISLSLKGAMTHDEMQEVVYLITKTELMLNPINDIQFIRELKQLELCFSQIQQGIKQLSDLVPYMITVKDFAKDTLKTEWERVKIGE